MSDSTGPKDVPSTSEGESDNAAHAPAASTPVAKGEPVVKRDAPDKDGNKRKARALDNLSTSLRHAYESTLEEQVPDPIMDLLRQLD